MDVREAIRSRSSVRMYDGRKIPDDVVHSILDAARLAPSGCNAQPWRFRIVRDAETIEELKRQEAFPQAFVCKAPLY